MKTHQMIAGIALLSLSMCVGASDAVNAGDIVASVGNNGYSRQPHVHIGAWRGEVAL